MMRKYSKRKYTQAQINWCKNYEFITGIEPMMCNFEAGEQTFQEAASWNVHWFEDWMHDAHHDCDLDQLSMKVYKSA